MGLRVIPSAVTTSSDSGKTILTYQPDGVTNNITTATTIPRDNTRPEFTEGEAIDAITLTPTSAASDFDILYVVNGSHSATNSEKIAFLTQEGDQVIASGGRTFTFSGSTLTLSSGDLINNEGWTDSMRLVITGSAAGNNGEYAISSLTATVVTITGSFTAEGPISATTAASAETDALAVASTFDQQGDAIFNLTLPYVIESPPIGVPINLNVYVGSPDAGNLDINGIAGGGLWGGYSATGFTVREIYQ